MMMRWMAGAIRRQMRSRLLDMSGVAGELRGRLRPGRGNLGALVPLTHPYRPSLSLSLSLALAP